jgi:hypothetical protein
MKSTTIAIMFVLASAVGGATHAAPQSKTETRCGWMSNPSPSNWWLTDRAGEWTIGQQGDFQAEGDELPDFSTHDWVVTNPPDYGYGCACVTGIYDKKTMRVLRIDLASQRTLRQCKVDKALKKPE